MNGENLISWNIPNFITFVFMIAILWVVIGTAGHLLIRQPYLRQSSATNLPSGSATVVG